MSELGAVFETGGAAAAEYAASHLAARGGHCANCGSALNGPYCATCGQPTDVHRRSLFGLAHDLISDLASFDNRIIRTTVALMLKPGALVAAYREGRTQPFVPPVRLYLFVSLLFFLTLSMTHLALVQFALRATQLPVSLDDRGKPYMMSGGEKIPLPHRYAGEKKHYSFDADVSFFTKLGSRHSQLDPAALERLNARMTGELGDDKDTSVVQRGINDTLNKLGTNPAALNGAISEWVPRILFALLPLFGFLMAVFYWRQRRDFYLVDHMVFSLNFHSFGFALLLAAAGVAQFLPGAWLAWAVSGLMGLYLLLAMKRVYGQGWVWTGLKWWMIGSMYIMFFLFPACIVVVVLSVFGIG